MEDMKKMLDKKKKEGDPLKKQAKLSALKNLRSAMSGMMQGDLGDKMNKVTVAAPDKESLEAGLDKAKDVLDDMPSEDSDMEMEESPSMESEEPAMSEQEIDQMMQKLMEMKKKLKE